MNEELKETKEENVGSQLIVANVGELRKASRSNTIHYFRFKQWSNENI